MTPWRAAVQASLPECPSPTSRSCFETSRSGRTADSSADPARPRGARPLALLLRRDRGPRQRPIPRRRAPRRQAQGRAEGARVRNQSTSVRCSHGAARASRADAAKKASRRPCIPTMSPTDIFGSIWLKAPSTRGAYRSCSTTRTRMPHTAQGSATARRLGVVHMHLRREPVRGAPGLDRSPDQLRDGRRQSARLRDAILDKPVLVDDEPRRQLLVASDDRRQTSKLPNTFALGIPRP